MLVVWNVTGCVGPVVCGEDGSGAHRLDPCGGVIVIRRNSSSEGNHLINLVQMKS